MVGDILQPTHLFFVLVIALLVLGPKRLPEVGRALGNGLRDFRTAISGDNADDHRHEIESEPLPAEEPPHEAQPAALAAPAVPKRPEAFASGAESQPAPISVEPPSQPSEPILVEPSSSQPPQPSPDRLG